MSGQLVECVPNFSEGRDPATVRQIAEAIGSVPGIMVLDAHSDSDHNRSVITFAGPPEAALEASIRSAGAAVERIDLRRHQGVHPWIGALDVLPFVPLSDITLSDCAGLAVRAAEEIWGRYRVPVYLYEAAARRPDRINLADIRHAVRSRSDCVPDIGGPDLHPTAGAAVAGARKFLIAYNIQLATPDVAVAQTIARRIRASSGGLPYVKAMGVFLAARGQAQVSMNLTDFEVTPPHCVFEAVRQEAARLGVDVASSELVGLIPRKAIEMAAGFDLKIEGFHDGLILENRVAELLR